MGETSPERGLRIPASSSLCAFFTGRAAARGVGSLIAVCTEYRKRGGPKRSFPKALSQSLLVLPAQLSSWGPLGVELLQHGQLIICGRPRELRGHPPSWPRRAVHTHQHRAPAHRLTVLCDERGTVLPSLRRRGPGGLIERAHHRGRGVAGTGPGCRIEQQRSTKPRSIASRITDDPDKGMRAGLPCGPLGCHGPASCIPLLLCLLLQRHGAAVAGDSLGVEPCQHAPAHQLWHHRFPHCDLCRVEVCRRGRRLDEVGIPKSARCACAHGSVVSPTPDDSPRCPARTHREWATPRAGGSSPYEKRPQA